MADTPDYPIPKNPDEFSFAELFDSDQRYNFVLGASRGYDGVVQSIAQVKEALGLEPDGYAEYVTQELLKDQDILRGTSQHATQLSGAAGVQMGAELLPALAVPMGGSVLGSTLLGGLASSSIFHDNVNDSRAGEIGIGLLAGAGAGWITRLLRGGPAKRIAETEVNKVADQTVDRAGAPISDLQRAGLRAEDFYPQSNPKGLPQTPVRPAPSPVAPVVDTTLDATGAPISNLQRAGLTAEDFYPQSSPKGLPQTQLRIMDQPQDLVGPRPRNPARAMDKVKAALASGKAGASEMVDSAIKNAKAFSEKSARLAKIQAARLASVEKALATRAGAEAFSQEGMAATRKVMEARKAAAEAAKTAAAGGVLLRSLEDVKRGSRLLAHPDSLGRATLASDVTYGTYAAKPVVDAVPEGIRNAPKMFPPYTPKLPSQKNIGDMTVKELVDEIQTMHPNAKLSKNKSSLQQTLEWMRNTAERMATAGRQTLGGRPGPVPKRGRGRPKNQSGFINTDLQARFSGAGVGGLVGGALGGMASDDGSGTLPGAIAGAFGMAVAGPRLAAAAARAADDARRVALRKVGADAGKLNETITRNQLVKNYSKEAILNTIVEGRKIVDEFAGGVMTRLHQLSPRVAIALTSAEYRQHQMNQVFLSRGEEVFNKIADMNLTDTQAKALKIALLNSTEKAKTVLNAFGKDGTVIDGFQTLMNDAGDYLTRAGLGDTLRKNYFPRMITDTSYFEAIPEFKTYLEKLAREKKVSELTQFEKEVALTDIINGTMLRGPKNTAWGKAASQLQRRTTKVTAENVDAYADPLQGFHDYVSNITAQAERRNFFRGLGVKVDDLGPNAENIDSIAARLAKELSDGTMTPEQVDETARLIRMRFGPGEQAPHRAWQNFKNVTYMGLLGNPFAAATQFGDVALSMYRNGIGNTVASMTEQLTGRGKLKGLDKQELLGIRNAATDFASKVSTRDALNWSLKYSGFQKMDTFGKNTFINAAMRKNQQMDAATFKARWAPIFDKGIDGPTPNTDKLFEQVQSFKGITPENREDLGFMLWNDITEAQPITLSSMPERYLQHPNGRTAYMLQSFTLKLFDVMRRDIVQQYAKGNKLQAMKNATYLSTLFVMTNGTVDQAKNFITNKDTPLLDVVLNNYLKLAGMSKWTLDSVAKDGAGTALLKQLAPPMAIPDAIGDARKTLQLMPVGGRAVDALINR